MGTEVLAPQDFWTEKFRWSPPGIYRRRNYHPNNNRNEFSNARHHRKPSLSRMEKFEQRRKSLSPSPPQSPSPSPTPSKQPQRQQLLPASPIPRRSSSADELQTHFIQFGVPPQMGPVRRRQSLDTIDATRMKRDMNNKARGGFIMKNYMDEIDVYAGSAFFTSPSPSSLPLPSFFNNNNNNKIVTIKNDQFHDSATRDLRRLLRLE